MKPLSIIKLVEDCDKIILYSSNRRYASIEGTKKELIEQAKLPEKHRALIWKCDVEYISVAPLELYSKKMKNGKRKKVYGSQLMIAVEGKEVQYK